ncbi:MAG: hypothetical protein ACLFS9_06030, partial [Nitriliruptoraceae bacterium]
VEITNVINCGPADDSTDGNTDNGTGNDNTDNGTGNDNTDDGTDDNTDNGTGNDSTDEIEEGDVADGSDPADQADLTDGIEETEVLGELEEANDAEQEEAADDDELEEVERVGVRNSDTTEVADTTDVGVELSRTGFDAGTLLTLGLLLSMIGLMALRLGRRREQTTAT